MNEFITYLFDAVQIELNLRIYLVERLYLGRYLVVGSPAGSVSLWTLITRARIDGETATPRRRGKV